MGQPSFQASNAIIYLTYGAFLYVSRSSSTSYVLLLTSARVTGLYIAWRWRHQSKSEFLASNRTQKGQTSSTGEPPPALPPSLPPVQNPLANLSTAFPLALNFIASGECHAQLLR